MTTLVKKIKRGHPYWYAVQSKRINGKPRIVWQKYLGRAEDLVANLETKVAPQPQSCEVRKFGTVAALLTIAEDLGLVSIIDQVIPKRNQGPSVGEYALLAIINRVVDPKSKLQIGDWYEKTILQRLWSFPKSAFSSQQFWKIMNSFDEEAIAEIEKKLVERMIEKQLIETQTLIYDATNFATYINPSNQRNSIAKFGRAKNKRSDLRIVGLALLVTKDFKVPLLHDTYEGNLNDFSEFRAVILSLAERYRLLTQKQEEMTLIFDRGNNGEENLSLLDIENVKFITPLKRVQAADLLDVSLEKYTALTSQNLAGVKAYRSMRRISGIDATVVIIFSESFYTNEVTGLMAQLSSAIGKLDIEAKRLDKWQKTEAKHVINKRATTDINEKNLKKRVEEILNKHEMNDYINFIVDKNKDGFPILKYETNLKKFNDHISRYCGKLIYLTNRHDWSDGQIVAAYRGQTEIEDVFRSLKDRDYLHWGPAFHWTDQKIRAHSFFCVLAYTLISLARKKALEAHIQISIHELIEQLNEINEVLILYPPSQPTNQPRLCTTYTEMDRLQKKLAIALELSSKMKK